MCEFDLKLGFWQEKALWEFNILKYLVRIKLKIGFSLTYPEEFHRGLRMLKQLSPISNKTYVISYRFTVSQYWPKTGLMMQSLECFNEPSEKTRVIAFISSLNISLIILFTLVTFRVYDLV